MQLCGIRRSRLNNQHRSFAQYYEEAAGILPCALVTANGIAPTGNFNLCIARVPCSGKSVFMQELMLSILGVSGKAFMLDYGRSFKRTCLLLGGSYIEFDVKNLTSINPFSEVPEDNSERAVEAKADFSKFSLYFSHHGSSTIWPNDL